MYTLCQTFRTIAYETWDKLAEAESVNFQISEESLTDFILLKLKLRHPDDIKIKSFNKKTEEPITGADWEFWIEDNNQWVGFRVQAKIINLATFEFSGLHYRSNKGGYQCDNLIYDSLDSNIVMFPLYCLYSYWKPFEFYSQQDTYYNIGINEYFGCSFVDAFTILNLRRKRSKHIIDIFPNMNPWNSLVCPVIHDMGGIVLHSIDIYLDWCYKSLLKNTDIDKETREYLSIIEEAIPHREPPSYVQEILENGNTNIIVNNVKHVVIYSYPH